MVVGLPAKPHPGTVCRVAVSATRHTPVNLAVVYFTDRGIEELVARRGEEEVSFEWLADQLRTFVDLNPDFETPVERLATWLARLDDDED
jgi:hypothetical protein